MPRARCALAPHPNSGLPEFGIKTDRSRVNPTSVGERVARALSVFTRVFDALWRGPGEGQPSRRNLLCANRV
jgi:hypothetical protein